MVTWNNLDTLKSYDKLKELKGHVDIKEAMAGENGAKRVAEYTVPMASGLNFNYAAKQVDDEVLNVLAELAEEQQLVDKFEELYNGAVINTGEQRLVLHHLARRQLGTDVVVDGVNKREFYVAQQQKAAVRVRVYPRRVGQRTGKQQQQRRNQRGKSSCVLHRLSSFA